MKNEDIEFHQSIIRGIGVILEAYKNWLARKKERAT